MFMFIYMLCFMCRSNVICMFVFICVVRFMVISIFIFKFTPFHVNQFNKVDFNFCVTLYKYIWLFVFLSLYAFCVYF